ncbi:uroporphyrinogen-III synthase [Leucobacter viscericola]|uniref:Uroporphyrinogen-III synthase n=1 Tax=Leucobacter viscericola TaxID=2714935 RepID=A0A6G7XG21_9MICO|nr:uroporphyrinogen-III synthase [Leucobacter viscericola]QIK63416.1 uroporphyrinogen-III synthase [Leucobacter viscericola]
MTETAERLLADASLRGARVLILRGGPWGDRVAAQVRDRGGEPIVYPLIEIEPVDTPELRAAVERWRRGAYDWVVLTSANAVNAALAVADGAFESIADAGGAATPGSGSGSGAGSRSRIAAVGPGTATAARAAGLGVDLMPEHDFSTDGLIAALDAELSSGPSFEQQRILLPLSNLSDDRLQTWLATAGHLVDRVTAYETVQIEQDVRSRAACATALADSDLILVTSGSAARALAANLSAVDAAVPPTIAAIGEPTATALRDVGLAPQIVAGTQTIDGLLDAIVAQVNEPNHQ